MKIFDKDNQTDDDNKDKLDGWDSTNVTKPQYYSVDESLKEQDNARDEKSLEYVKTPDSYIKRAAKRVASFVDWVGAKRFAIASGMVFGAISGLIGIAQNNAPMAIFGYGVASTTGIIAYNVMKKDIEQHRKNQEQSYNQEQYEKSEDNNRQNEYYTSQADKNHNLDEDER